jgi:ABC-type nitrate/sulfonate/bicarbonate transport system permease component
VLALWLPASVIALWQVLSSQRMVNVLFFPPPSEVLSAGWGMMKSGELGMHLGATMSRLLTGAAIGAFCGLACGLAMGALEPVRRSLEPVISALNSTPKLALLPMLMLITGIDETARLIPIALTCFVTLAIHGLDAVRGVNQAYIELACNYGAGRRGMLRRVYLPATLPQIFTGLRVALGRALVIAISIEIVSAPTGLGSMIWMAWQTFSTDKLYVGVIAAAAMGLLFHNGLEWLEQRLVPWRSRARHA